MHSAQELVTQIDALTSLPSVYIRVREQLDAPEGSLTEVVRAVSADPALTARLLHVVNSALYGYGGQIDTVGRAVTILGLQQVHDLVLVMSVSSMFANFRPAHLDMNRFWRGSVLCAIASREIAVGCALPSAERMFAIGLLADLGHLVMYQTVPTLTLDARSAASEQGEPLFEAERRIVGCDHAEVGAALLAHWRLPACFAEIVGAQINPRLGGENTYEAAILHVATQVVQADRNDESSESAAARIDPVIWGQLEMTPESLGRIREDSELKLSGYISLFFPELRMQ